MQNLELDSLLVEKHTGRLLVAPENESAVRKILTNDNSCTYQMITLALDSHAIHKVIHEDM